MFNQNELSYLLTAVQTMPVNSTDDARNKGSMSIKIADIMDAQAQAEQKKAESKEPIKLPKSEGSAKGKSH